MGCFSLLNIYEPKSLGLFIKFQPIMRQVNFFIPGLALGCPAEGRGFMFIVKRLHGQRAGCKPRS
ncbi:hypothetical protein IV01_14610 [Pseudomonas syringae]|uniref:Uncharacterized protein n=1 Tax=Pseudomonas syringae TaxID=317 RepID=A0A085VH92_PSESX|nr:hypothetical protein IV01_14610 [Pseudomonas syringae]